MLKRSARYWGCGKRASERVTRHTRKGRRGFDVPADSFEYGLKPMKWWNAVRRLGNTSSAFDFIVLCVFVILILYTLIRLS